MYASKHDADSTRHTRASALVLKYQSTLRRAYAVALLRLVEGRDFDALNPRFLKPRIRPRMRLDLGSSFHFYESGANFATARGGKMYPFSC